MALTVVQILPALEVGGVERGTIQVAEALVQAGHRALVVSRGGRLVAELERAGAEHIPWPVGAKSPLGLRWVPKLRRLLTERRADILHARSRFPAWLAWMAWRGMAAQTRPRFVTTVHGPYSVNAYSAIMTRGERVIAISEFIRGYVLDNYPQVPASRVTVIHRGISRDRYPYRYEPDEAWRAKWRSELPMLAGRYVVLLPARITRWKGHEDFIAVLQRLVGLGVPVHGLIAGDAEARRAAFLQEIKAAVASAGLNERVTFLGARDDLREIMAASDAVVSLTRAPEAFGRTTLEALALGTPVVGYDHGGTREILQRVFPQGLCAVGDADAAAALLARFHAARPQVPRFDDFNLETMLARELTLYEELAAEPRR